MSDDVQYDLETCLRRLQFALNDKYPITGVVLDRRVVESVIHFLERPVDADAVAKVKRATIEIEEGKLDAEVVFEGPAVRLFAAAAIAWFKKSKGENYVQCIINDASGGEQYTLTMQRSGGSTPGELVTEYRNKLEALRADLNEAYNNGRVDLACQLADELIRKHWENL